MTSLVWILPIQHTHSARDSDKARETRDITENPRGGHTAVLIAALVVVVVIVVANPSKHRLSDNKTRGATAVVVRPTT